ncbi:MAG TPA: alpha/beta fold hydrolase [Chloroflexia bacterium]|nr:alpha/beta fold hydrolase [Chloroflexia bacterium]
MKTMRSALRVLLAGATLLLAGCDLGPASTPTSVLAPPENTPTSPAAAPTSTASPLPSTPTLTPGGPTGNLPSQAQQFVDLLVQQDFATAEQRLDPTMRQQLPADKLASTWQSLLAQVGAFKTQVGTRTTTAQQNGTTYRIVFVTCAFAQANIDVRLVFDPDGQIGGLFFSPAPAAGPTPSPGATNLPAYVQPTAYQETAVQVGSGAWVLPGTLTLPVGAGPFPAVVLVHGSGPQDRDETIGPNKPFRDLAWGLASQGIAVLRYDKRTKVYPRQMAALVQTITLDQETTDDALAAVTVLRSTPQIDPHRIFVLGHSLGGMDIPRIGTRDPQLAGLIVLAGLARPFADTLLDQYTYIFSLAGTPTPDQQQQLDTLKAQVALVDSPALAPDTPASKLPLGIPAAYWLDLRGYHPAEVARGLAQPMLILQGEADYQVTMADFQIWKDALQARRNVTFKSYPHLYHLFIETPNAKAQPQDYQVAGHVTAAVVQDIAAWINQNR